MTSQRSLILVLLGALVILTVVVNWPVLRNGFTNLDDPQLVVNNRNIRSLSADHVRSLFSKSYAGLGGYTPLVLLSYAVEYHFFGLDPEAFHRTNLILHVINTLLVFGLLFQISGSLGISVVAAAFFGLHPLHIEPVAWIQGRKDLLFSMFYLGGLMAYVGYLRKNRRALFYAASLLLFCLALFSKVTAMSFPLVVLLLERHFAGKIDRPALLRTLPFWLLSGVFFVLSFLSHDSMTARTMGQTPSYWDNLSAFFYAFPFYAGKVFAPFRLFPGYSNSIGHDPGQAVLSFAALAVLAALVVLAYRRRRDLVTFGIGFAVLTLLPTLPFHFYGQPYEDRYMYLPLAGILVALAGLIPEKALGAKPASKLGVAVWPALILLATGLGAVSWNQAHVWHDSFSLWSQAVKKDPTNSVGYVNRAGAFEETGELAQALSDLERAKSLAPNNPWIDLSIAGVHFKQGAYDRTLDELNLLIAKDPLFYDGYMSRGKLWSNAKKYEEAVKDFTRALMINKSYEAYCFRAQAYIDTQRFPQALEDLRAAYGIEPTDRVRELIARLSGRDAAETRR